MTLARERAIATAFLLAGDEDLREGMVAAQEMGVAVNVLGIPTTNAQDENQAATLIREADQHVLLPAALLEPFIRSSQADLPLGGSTGDERTTVRDVAVERPPADEDESRSASLAASEFAASWLQENPRGLPDLLAQAPVIPTRIDAELLSAVEAATGKSLREREGLRKDVRASFWSIVKAAAGSRTVGEDTGRGVQRAEDI